jgi:thiamine-monophosphate kinase
MFENKDKTTFESLGEFGLIHHLTSSFHLHHATTIKGIGDDAAVIDPGGDSYILVSTDCLIEGVHFDFVYSPLKHLGYKAITSNISDIVAMNGKATHALITIGMSSKMTLEAIEEFYAGVHIACQDYGIDLIGGDTSTSRKGFFISITIIGQVNKQAVVYRNGAKANHLVCVTGDLGGAYTGYMILEREKRLFMENPSIQPDMEGKDYILQRQLRPEARKDVVSLFETLSIIPTSMIDISDGLSSELFHLASQSKVGIDIFEDKLPIDPITYQTARDLGLDPTTCALNGGEDYELLFTIHASDYEKIKNQPDITAIGYVTEEVGKLQLHSNGGLTHPIMAQGWTHLKA